MDDPRCNTQFPNREWFHEEIFVVGILAFSELAFSFFFSSLCKIGNLHNLEGEATKEEKPIIFPLSMEIWNKH